MIETTEINIRFRAYQGTPEYELIEYIKRQPISSKRIILEILKIFYLPIAQLEKEKSDLEEIRKTAKNSSSLLRNQAEYIERKVGIDAEVKLNPNTDQFFEHLHGKGHEVKQKEKPENLSLNKGLKKSDIF